MELRKLEFKTVKEIYHKHLCHDFIPSEQKPLIVMQILTKMGLYHCYGLYQMDELLGYAFFLEMKNQERAVLLLDYFVVISEQRDKGIGTKFMTLLLEEYKEFDYLIAEVETVDLAIDEVEQNIRDRRKRFYIKNGYQITNLSVDLFGENLQIYIRPIRKERVSEEQVYDDLNLIYDKMFYEKDVREKVRLMKTK